MTRNWRSYYTPAIRLSLIELLILIFVFFVLLVVNLCDQAANDSGSWKSTSREG
jgi:hypothetical protein